MVKEGYKVLLLEAGGSSPWVSQVRLNDKPQT